MPESVRLIDDPILRAVCAPVDLNLFGVDQLLSLMYDAMTAKGGIGIAANQVGHSWRIFILKDNSSYIAYINPEVVSMEELVQFEGEACLSIPGASATTNRYKRLTLTWQGVDGISISASFQGMDAFAIQHEMDHLNGKLYIDQFGPMRRDMIMRKHRKFLRGR